MSGYRPCPTSLYQFIKITRPFFVIIKFRFFINMRILQIFSKQNISQFRTCVEKTLSQGLLMAHMLQQGHGT